MTRDVPMFHPKSHLQGAILEKQDMPCRNTGTFDSDPESSPLQATGPGAADCYREIPDLHRACCPTSFGKETLQHIFLHEISKTV